VVASFEPAGCFSWERAAGLHLGGRGLGPVSGKAVCRACMAGNSSRLTRALRSVAGGCAAEEATSSIASTRPLNQTVQLKMRYQEGPEQVRCLFADRAFCEVRNEDAPSVHCER
jgi:outer membrane lipoprotein SlyB